MRLKEESQKNSQIIQLQREQEYMKNSSIKEMIRHQKMQAEERKHQVSPVLISMFQKLITFSAHVGNGWETAATAKSSDQLYPGGERQALGNRAESGRT